MSLKQDWTNGKASDCSNLGCFYAGGPSECLDHCVDDPDCNLVNFCPDGASCANVNRCCPRKCDGGVTKLVDTWKGWNIYIKGMRFLY